MPFIKGIIPVVKEMFQKLRIKTNTQKKQDVLVNFKIDDQIPIKIKLILLYKF